MSGKLWPDMDGFGRLWTLSAAVFRPRRSPPFSLEGFGGRASGNSARFSPAGRRFGRGRQPPAGQAGGGFELPKNQAPAETLLPVLIHRYGYWNSAGNKGRGAAGADLSRGERGEPIAPLSNSTWKGRFRRFAPNLFPPGRKKCPLWPSVVAGGGRGASRWLNVARLRRTPYSTEKTVFRRVAVVERFRRVATP
jgi:hypothetical protein